MTNTTKPAATQYEFVAYDVLQVRYLTRDTAPKWMDYSTIRTATEGRQAVGMVNDEKETLCEFRIVSSRGVVKYARQQDPTRELSVLLRSEAVDKMAREAAADELTRAKFAVAEAVLNAKGTLEALSTPRWLRDMNDRGREEMEELVRDDVLGMLEALKGWDVASRAFVASLAKPAKARAAK